MTNAEHPYSHGPSEIKGHVPASVEDLLHQLDRVGQPGGQGYDQEGLNQLKSWMAAEPDPSDAEPVPSGNTRETSVKFLIAGGERAGAAEFIHAVSEDWNWTLPLMPVPQEGEHPRSASSYRLFFGRSKLAEGLVMYHFATPTPAVAATWDDLARGAVGALVLADVRYMEDCHHALDYLDSGQIPYVVVVRGTSETCPYPVAHIREALSLDDDVPIRYWESGSPFGQWRARSSGKAALIALIEHALERRQNENPTDLDVDLFVLSLLAQLDLLKQ